jgi:hypothetical protein
MFRITMRVILVLLVYHSKFSYQSFLIDHTNLNYNSEIQNLDDHGDNTVFWAGFLHGLGIFQNVTHKAECLAILPVVHDDLVAIHDRIRNITDFKEMIEASKFITQKLEEIYKKFDETSTPCKKMLDDIRKIKEKVIIYLQAAEIQKKIYLHLFQNLWTVIQKWQNIGDHCRDRDWYRAGYEFGDVVRFVFIWDLQLSNKDSLDLKLFDDNYFNKPPFNF